MTPAELEALGRAVWLFYRRRAHQWTSTAIRNGWISPAPAHVCADCGRVAQVYDHRDYMQPEKVEPVCHPCNIRRGPARALKVARIIDQLFTGEVHADCEGVTVDAEA